MTAKINYINIGIVLVLLVSGVAVAFQDGQRDKASVATGITTIGKSISNIAPSSSLHEAMPSIMVDQTTNTATVASGYSLLVVALVIVAAVLMLGSISCFRYCAEC